MTEVLGGRYRLDERLAAGGMGEVWQATDQVLTRPIAVKLLRQEYVSDEAARTRFQAEARYAAALQHGGIAQVYDYGEQDDRAYLVMELVPGEPLSRILARTGGLTPEAVLDLIAQAARALQVAHTAGIVHRDVKPGNLMVTVDGTLKITDFGIARGPAAGTLTQTGIVMGTAHYISPEQASGQQITAATDLYSLGVVAYECLAGHPPFQAEGPVAIALMHVREVPPELPAQVPGPLRDLVRDLLAKDPAERPGSAQEVADRAFVVRDSLALGLPEQDVRVEPVPPTAPVPTAAPSDLAMGGGPDTLATEEVPAQRRPALLLTSVAAGVVILGIIVVGSLLRGPASADLVDDRRTGSPAVLPGPAGSGGRPDRPKPDGTGPDPEHVFTRAPANGGATTTPGAPSASFSSKPTAPRTSNSPTARRTTPPPTVSTPPSSTPTGTPSGSPDGG